MGPRQHSRPSRAEQPRPWAASSEPRLTLSPGGRGWPAEPAGRGGTGSGEYARDSQFDRPEHEIVRDSHRHEALFREPSVPLAVRSPPLLSPMRLAIELHDQLLLGAEEIH